MSLLPLLCGAAFDAQAGSGPIYAGSDSAPLDVRAGTPQQTVCTITVNSADEKEAFRRHLPAGRYRFVELVERGRPDWLETARREGVRCDILIISGHYDGGDYAGGNEFFSEHVDTHEFLRVDEMERVACSDPDNGLFSHLKAVYLFGCNTLNPEALHSEADIARLLVQSGHAQAEAQRLAHALNVRYADSSRDRMRHIFKDVPAIYGFSSVAPLGPVAATYLERYLRAGGARDVANGRPDPRVASYFPGHSLTVARGLRDGDVDAGFRADVCRFVDDRLSPARKVEAIHRLLERDMAEVRMFVDRMERFTASLDERTRQQPDVAEALAAIADDAAARARYLEFLRRVDRPALRARFVELAGEFAWLSPAGVQGELMRMIGERYAQSPVTAADVDLVCRLNEAHDLAHGLALLPAPGAEDPGHAAIRACLGSPDDHARVLQALVSPQPSDVQIAQVYLRHHPVDNVAELRGLASGIVGMTDAAAQVRALDALAHHRLADRETLETLTRYFPVAPTLDVQRAIAGILIRSDFDLIDTPELVRALRDHRLKSPDGRDLIDVLIRRLDVAQAPA
ncbi:MAG TPA: hypothetical protein VJV77_01470 [Casimicrobiaceae bacterium]|nr:hypothetical protein [Casimicrobiaceae bacterium]